MESKHFKTEEPNSQFRVCNCCMSENVTEVYFKTKSNSCITVALCNDCLKELQEVIPLILKENEENKNDNQ